MCGIVGFNWDDKKLIREMAGKIIHRGPDQYGYYCDSQISLGHRRLSIIDLSVKGKQPMTSEDGRYVLVYNGEVYNFREIRNKLRRNHEFRSRTDSEVILHAYEEYGDSCINMLNGMFAFAIWDNKEKELVLARDHAGIKPLYYYFDGKNFIFASEIKAFIDYIERKINKGAISDYFSLRYVPGEETLFLNVKKLLPGHVLKYKDGKISIKKFWNTDFTTQEFSMEYARRQVRKLLDESVRSQLMSDVPLGAFLSGGLDSSALVALMSKASSRGKPVHTFSVDFGESDLSEGKYARLVAERFNTDHHEIVVERNALDVIKDVAWHLDEPLGDAACIPTYMMSEVTRKHVKVILSGDGSDEIFAGYDKYFFMKQKYNLRRILKFMKPITPNIKIGMKIFDKGIRLIRESGDAASDYWVLHERFSPEQKVMMLKTKKLPEPYSLSRYTDNDYSLLNKVLNIDFHEWLPHDLMLKTDKMTMAHSLESRVPFLDKNLISFAAKIPSQWKMHFMTEKYIYRKAMKGILPEEILRRKKQGFNIPLKKWLDEGLKEYFMDIVKENRSRVIDPRYYKKAIQKLDSKKPDDQQFWALFMFEMWYNQYFTLR